MEKLLDGFAVNFRYFITLLIFSLLIRAFLASLRALKRNGEIREPFLECAWGIFLGFPMGQTDEDIKKADHWCNYILGLIELSGYSILMAANEWKIIGAWLGFKTLAQWNVWKDDRTTFNRFLIGNAIVVIVAFIFLAPLVKLDPTHAGVSFPPSRESVGYLWLHKFPSNFELYAQIIAAVMFFIGTLLLAFSHEPYNPNYKKNHYMPMKLIRWRFQLGISLNFFGFLLIVLVSIGKFV